VSSQLCWNEPDFPGRSQVVRLPTGMSASKWYTFLRSSGSVAGSDTLRSL